MPRFSAISELLGGDDAGVRRVLCAFRNEMGEDIRLLDDAMLSEDWKLAGVVTLRAAMACHLVGEMQAGIRLETLANASELSTESSVLVRYAECARDLLMDLKVCVSACVEDASCSSVSLDEIRLFPISPEQMGA